MLVECAREGCDEVFVRKQHNQKYHNNDCCKLATNQRLMRRYYKRRDQKLGKVRVCEECETKLSRYNDNDVCSSCELKRQTEANNSVKSMILSVTWQV